MTQDTNGKFFRYKSEDDEQFDITISLSCIKTIYKDEDCVLGVAYGSPIVTLKAEYANSEDRDRVYEAIVAKLNPIV